MKYLYALFCMLSLTCSAQEARLYRTVDDYFSGRTETEIVHIKQVTTDPAFRGEFTNDFKISSKNNYLNTNLKDSYWGVERNDSLFLNANIIRDNVQTIYTNVYEIKSTGYCHVLFHSKKFMCFEMQLGGRKKKSSSAFSADYRSGIRASRVNCVLDLTTNRVYILSRYVVEQFLEAKPELLKQYIDAGSPETMDTYIVVFEQLS